MSKILKSGHTYKLVEGEELERLKRYALFSDGALRMNPGGWILQKAYLKFADLIYSFKIRPTDVFVNTFPKSGTTWMQEIIWNILFNPDLDNPVAKTTICARFPNFEGDMYMATPGAPQFNPEGEVMRRFKEVCPGKDPSRGTLIHIGEFNPDPRLNKGHLPLPLLPPDVFTIGKVIYVARDPRDVLFSYYHFARLHVIWSFKGSFEDFFEDFLDDLTLFSKYWEHMKCAWEQRNHPRFLFTYYEDLKTDVIKEIKKVDKFLGTNLTEKQIQNVAYITSFEQMKTNSNDNPPTSNDKANFIQEVADKDGGFFRKGQVGEWKEKLTPEQLTKINEWMEKNLTSFGAEFKYRV